MLEDLIVNKKILPTLKVLYESNPDGFVPELSKMVTFQKNEKVKVPLIMNVLTSHNYSDVDEVLDFCLSKGYSLIDKPLNYLVKKKTANHKIGDVVTIDEVNFLLLYSENVKLVDGVLFNYLKEVKSSEQFEKDFTSLRDLLNEKILSNGFKNFQNFIHKSGNDNYVCLAEIFEKNMNNFERFSAVSNLESLSQENKEKFLNLVIKRLNILAANKIDVTTSAFKSIIDVVHVLAKDLTIEQKSKLLVEVPQYPIYREFSKVLNFKIKSPGFVGVPWQSITDNYFKIVEKKESWYLSKWNFIDNKFLDLLLDKDVLNSTKTHKGMGIVETLFLMCREKDSNFFTKDVKEKIFQYIEISKIKSAIYNLPGFSDVIVKYLIIEDSKGEDGMIKRFFKNPENKKFIPALMEKVDMDFWNRNVSKIGKQELNVFLSELENSGLNMVKFIEGVEGLNNFEKTKSFNFLIAKNQLTHLHGSIFNRYDKIDASNKVLSVLDLMDKMLATNDVNYVGLEKAIKSFSSDNFRDLNLKISENMSSGNWKYNSSQYLDLSKVIQSEQIKLSIKNKVSKNNNDDNVFKM